MCDSSLTKKEKEKKKLTIVEEVSKEGLVENGGRTEKEEDIHGVSEG